MKMALYVLVMAGVSYFIRMLPITVFRKEIKSVRLKSFLYYMPYAVLGAMTFPAVLYSTGSVISAAAGMAGAVIAAYFNKGLMAAAALSVAAAFLVQMII